MAKSVEAQPELKRAQEFRAIADALLHDPHNDWNDWEFDFLTHEADRRPTYIYSDREWRVLRRLQYCARSFAQYSDHTVPELTAIAYQGRADFGEDQEFVEKLHLWQASRLKCRQIGRLASLCRLFEPIGQDSLVDQEFVEESDENIGLVSQAMVA